GADVLERWLPLWLLTASLLALAWPWSGFDPFLISKPYLFWLIALAMFAIGWLLPRDELLRVVRRWPVVGMGTTIQFLAMPLAAYAAVRLGGFEGPVATGLLVVGCVPGAMASNVLTLLARGNVSYSISLTTLATLLSPLFVPAALWLLAGAQVQVDVPKMMFDLLMSIVVPVAAGHWLAHTLPKWEPLARRAGPLLANLAILWVIAVVVAANRANLTALSQNLGAGAPLLAALLGVNLAGYAAGYGGGWAARLPEPMRRALTLEIGMQNAGLGSALAAKYFSAEAAMPCALYTFGCMLTGTLLAQMWAARSLRAIAAADTKSETA
ncbi:MAG: bile acid:sodium symporter family protein, partial [Planctomycetales bacterium]|nr:bile acid:sodium symporter family protein [Planctomycetales bacterium]